MDPNLLYYGDNLDVLRRHVKDETVDLPGAVVERAPEGREVHLLAVSRDQLVVAEVKATHHSITVDVVRHTIDLGVRLGAGTVVVAALDDWSEAARSSLSDLVRVHGQTRLRLVGGQELMTRTEP